MQPGAIGAMSGATVEATREAGPGPDDFVARVAGSAGGDDPLLHLLLHEKDTERALALWLGHWQRSHAPEDGDDLLRMLERDIARIDERLAEQIDALLHHPEFQALEASWRGLHDLVGRVEPGANVRVRVLSAAWKELVRDLDRTIEFDQSTLFRRVYSDEFDMPGGEPFGVLIGDYEIRPRPGRGHPTDDIEPLKLISNVAAAAFAPFIAGAHPSLFGLDDFAGLERVGDLERTFGGLDYLKWRELRQSDDARFVALTAPRVLRREPHDEGHCSGFPYREDVSGPGLEKHLWGTAVYAYAAVLIRAFTRHGWFDDVRGTERGAEGGGLVGGLPTPSFRTDRPGVATKCSTDVIIDEELDRELASVGFLPLCDCPDTRYSAFHAAGSIQQPTTAFDRPAAIANARLSAKLPVVFNVSRFAHFLKVIARDKIGAALEPMELESILRRWLVRYISAADDLGPELRARYPLREANVQVRGRADRPGSYVCVAHLRPRPHLDEMSASLRLTTDLTTEWKAQALA
jgi:type VI secretion system protein ImpD